MRLRSRGLPTYGISSTLCKIDILSATPEHHYATSSLGSPGLIYKAQFYLCVCVWIRGKVKCNQIPNLRKDQN